MPRASQVFITFEGVIEQVFFRYPSYPNGRPAIAAFDKDGYAFCTVTVNLVDEEIGPNLFFIQNKKPYSDIAEQLERVGAIRYTGITADSGFVKNYASLWEFV